jgi:peptide/nickel transport system permease protein
MIRAFGLNEDMQRSYKSMTFVILLAALHLAVLLAAFIAPYDGIEQNREVPFAPPSVLHFVDAHGHFHARPRVYLWKARGDDLDLYDEDRDRAYPVQFFVPGYEYKVIGVFRAHLHLLNVESPGKIMLFGTDRFGRDIFSRTLLGGQMSLLAGLLATGVTICLGAIIGGSSGFYGGWLDRLWMQVADLFLALPWLYLLLAVRAFLPLQMEPRQAFVVLVLVVGLVGWAKPARLIRGVMLSAKERKFVLAAKGFGAGDYYIFRRHVLPQAYGVILTQAVLLVPQYVLAEITLSFLGLGIGEPVPTWGNMLNAVIQVHVLQEYWWTIAPGLAPIPFFLGYLVLGTTLANRFGQNAA